MTSSPWILCTSGSAIAKAGLNANTTLTGYSGNNKTILDNMSNEAEALVCVLCKRDVITDYASVLTANGKNLLQDLTASYIAQNIITYDPTGYSKAEATMLLNVLHDNIVRNINLLQNDNYRTYLGIVSN